MAPTPKVTKFVAKCLESSGATIKIPGAKAVDHAGFVVPDLNEAVGYFVETLGAAVLWWSPPFSVNKDQLKAPPGLNTAPGAAFRLAMLRLGPNLNVELIDTMCPTRAARYRLAVHWASGIWPSSLLTFAQQAGIWTGKVSSFFRAPTQH